MSAKARFHGSLADERAIKPMDKTGKLRMFSVMYDFCRDQGSIIAGVLALIAGCIAYRGAMRAAQQQVAAVNKQTDAVQQQNRDLRNESQRRLAQNGIVAIKLLSSVLEIIKADITKLEQLLDQPQYFGIDKFAPTNYRQLIYKPPLNIVWDDLGACGTLVISNYILLDAKISQFMRTEVYAVSVIQNELQIIINIIDALNHELESDATRHNAVLQQTRLI